VPDELSIPHLLRKLEVDPQNDAIKLCFEADNLCRRHYFDKAVEAAQHAEHIAHEVFDSELQAETLLYLSAMYAARHSSDDDFRDAIRSCERAIRALSQNQTNFVIAQLIQAQIELQFEKKDEALIHLYRAAQTLQKSIAFSRERRQLQQIGLYESLQTAANAAIVQIYGSFIEVQARSIAPKKRRRSGEIRAAPPNGQFIEPPIHLGPELLPFDFPIQLDWPTSLELSPKNMSMTSQAALLPNYNADTIDYIELIEISINKKTFAIEPLYTIPGSDNRAFRMYRDKEYVPVHVKSEEGKAELVDSYLLVQKQARPDHQRGVVAIENPNVSGENGFF
jgi:hypothetical protein